MRRGLILTALLLSLGGCVPGQPYITYYDDAWPGYYYNDGAPYYVVEGVQQPVIYHDGGWGYYDGYHHFHPAPDSVGRQLSTRHPNGAGVRPYAARPAPVQTGGGQAGGPSSRPGGQPAGGQPAGGQPAGGRPAQPQGQGGQARPGGGQPPSRPAPQQQPQQHGGHCPPGQHC